MRRLIKPLICCFVSSLFVMLAAGCNATGQTDNSNNNQTDNTNGDQTGGGTAKSNAFLGSASRGDVVVYTIDSEAQTYTWTNETTNVSGNGSFSPLSAHRLARGFFDLSEADNTYTALKLGNDVFITDNPTGHQSNKLAVVLGSTAIVDTSTAPGDYFYVHMDDDNTSVQWGMVRFLDDGTLTYHLYGSVRPESVGAPTFEGTGAGTWVAVDSADDGPGRTEFTVDGEVLDGMFYDGKVVVIDQGEGKGMWVGVRIPDAPLTVPDIVGVYQFMDLALEPAGGFTSKIGLYEIQDDSTVDFASLIGTDIKNPDDWNTGTGLSLTSVDNINHLFKVSGAATNSGFEAYVLFIPGEFLIHFDFSNNVFTGYGVGVWQAG